MTAEYVFFDKFVEITSGCSGLDPCVRSVFAAGNLPHGFHQRNGRFLPVVLVISSQHIFRQPVPPQGVNERALPLLEIRFWKTRFPALLDHHLNAGTGLFNKS